MAKLEFDVRVLQVIKYSDAYRIESVMHIIFFRHLKDMDFSLMF